VGEPLAIHIIFNNYPLIIPQSLKGTKWIVFNHKAVEYQASKTGSTPFGVDNNLPLIAWHFIPGY
jgi:hypothetical protein